MNYFSSNYNRINYPIATETSFGLRNAQLGAVHAIASFFTLQNTEPAIVVMPTGSGKTAVLNLSAYVLKASRVLVISSSVMVRGQIVEEFETLKTLKASNVFHKELQTPKVKEIKSPIRSVDEWNDLKEYDVIVGIPNSINEGINDDFRPESDMFDLVLVDEAHHVPAFTWTNIVKTFSNARKIFFTATPFRRDKKEIEGRLAYNYPLTKAFEDNIFGEIGYYPIITENPNTDLAIALETEKVFNKDKEQGYNHFIMVRTDTKDNATNLLKLYNDNTNLKLKKVDSTLSYSTIKKTIQQLKQGELDGIICVDMLGEGFDFPNLKIAAIHSPKKSLANTLQFIGRFARTNAEDIGEAKFLAIPSDIEIGKKKLYAEGAIWGDIIRNLSEETIEEEDDIKAFLDTFENDRVPTFSKDEISFYNLNPYCHVKIYRTEGIDLEGIAEISGHEIIYHAVSNDNNAIVFITKEVERPKWILTDELINIKHYFFMIYFDTDTGLLFIHSSIKSNQFYDDLIKTFGIGEVSRISKYEINKVLIDISNPEFFNIGMLNRSAHSGESYRIISGSNAENTIRKSHGKNYANGHVFLKGRSGESNITVGYSSGSKVWSNAYEKIPNFIRWCKIIASKIVSDREVKTNTGFDNLPIGRPVNTFPLQAHFANWHHETFSEYPIIQITQDGEIISSYQLLDFAIELVKESSSLEQVAINLIYDDLVIKLSYDFQNHFQFRELYELDFIIEYNGYCDKLITYLNETPFQIYLDDFATISNHEYFEPVREGQFQYTADNIVSYNWDEHDTDITKEFYDTEELKIENDEKNSIHETLQVKLIQENYDVLIYDHGTGEVADYISLKDNPDRVEICLYHIKGSSGEEPGNRVGDVYEVCMQAVKSQVWTVNKSAFENKILRRTNNREDKFLIGNKETFTSLMHANKSIIYRFSIVQPGISRDTFSARLSYILAATNDSLLNSGYEPLLVIGS